jgi:hypothetical protein
MSLGNSNCTIGKSNVGYALQFAPPAAAELLLQIARCSGGLASAH